MTAKQKKAAPAKKPTADAKVRGAFVKIAETLRALPDDDARRRVLRATAVLLGIED